MPARFTLGIEEEFQMVDRQTGQLSPHILTILEKGVSQFGDKIKPEMLQSAVEIVTDVCPNITAARLELQNMRKMLLHLLEDETYNHKRGHAPRCILERPAFNSKCTLY